MDSVSGFFLALLFVWLFLMAVFIGYGIEKSSWKEDCDALGVHLVDGKVYQCKLDARQPGN